MQIKDMFDLTGKVAIVTGGGRGLGQNLAEAGAHIVLCSRRVENCQKTAEDLTQLGVKTLALPCNVRSSQEIQAVIHETLKVFGRVDILINNSGVHWGANPEEFPMEGWQKVIETNIHGLFLFSQIAGRAMIRQKSGNIINISSVMGVVGTESDVGNSIAYSASKGAVIAFTKDLAAKWAKYNIRVNAIAPGWFPTDITKWAMENNRPRILSHIPMRRFGEGDELKGAAIFLASEASKYVTGIVLPVDGGYLSI
jgi:NAD(P)-dependent dehydrogenase (short-subunit alcohol dehydrogenase family)